jgi:integrase
MSIKGSRTTSDYYNFDELTMKGIKIIKQGDSPRLGFLVIVGINTGLRISDILKLTFEDLEQDSIDILEGKTGKKRTVRMNGNIHEALVILKSKTRITSGMVFLSKNNTPYSIQYINKWLKLNFKSGKLRCSTHSLRKTFARTIITRSANQMQTLNLLSEIFNHSSPAITRIYLGFRQEEIDDIYLSL